MTYSYLDDLNTSEGREAVATLASRKARWLNENTDKSGDVDDLGQRSR